MTKLFFRTELTSSTSVRYPEVVAMLILSTWQPSITSVGADDGRTAPKRSSCRFSLGICSVNSTRKIGWFSS